MSRTHHRVTQSTIYLMKRGLTHINTYKHRLKRLYFFILDLFPFAKICVNLRFNKDLNSVLLCGEIHLKPYRNESNLHRIFLSALQLAITRRTSRAGSTLIAYHLLVFGYCHFSGKVCINKI